MMSLRMTGVQPFAGRSLRRVCGRMERLRWWKDSFSELILISESLLRLGMCFYHWSSGGLQACLGIICIIVRIGGSCNWMSKCQGLSFHQCY